MTRDVLHRDAKTGLWSSSPEVAYYVANSLLSARHAATAIRCHWHVENSLHYTRDVTFQEDQSRIRHNPGVFARLRSFAYCVAIRLQPSIRIAMPPLSAASTNSSSGASVESVEQPWVRTPRRARSALLSDLLLITDCPESSDKAPTVRAGEGTSARHPGRW